MTRVDRLSGFEKTFTCAPGASADTNSAPRWRETWWDGEQLRGCRRRWALYVPEWSFVPAETPIIREFRL